MNAGPRPIITTNRSALTESQRVLLTAKRDGSHNCWVIHPKPFVIFSEMPLSLSTPFNLSQSATCPCVTAAISNANLSAFFYVRSKASDLLHDSCGGFVVCIFLQINVQIHPQIHPHTCYLKIVHIHS